MNYEIIKAIGPSIVSAIAIFSGLYYVHSKSDDRWATLKSETDNKWAALKSETDERWATLKSESDERWARLLESFTDFKNITVARFADVEKKVHYRK